MKKFFRKFEEKEVPGVFDSARIALDRPEEAQFPALEKLLNCPKGSVLLNVGCGKGELSLYLTRRDYRVTGLDLSAARIAEAQLAAARQKLDPARVRFEAANLEERVFPASSFDAILCMNFLDQLKYPVRTLLEFWRILKPGGRLILQIPGAYSPVKNERWKRFLPGREAAKEAGDDCLPWEMEKLLPELGWHLIDQFADLGPVSDVEPPTVEGNFRPGARIFKQTMANYWFFVAESSKGLV